MTDTQTYRRITVTLSERDHKRLRIMAAACGTSMQEIVASVIIDEVDDYEGRLAEELLAERNMS